MIVRSAKFYVYLHLQSPVLQGELNRITQLAESNPVKIRPMEFFTSFLRNDQIPFDGLTVDGHQLDCITSSKLLGVNLSTHIDNI